MLTILNIPIFLIASFLCITILAGWGSFSFKFFNVQTHPKFFSSYVLFGLVFLSTIIEFYHFFYPINWKLSFFVSLFGFLNFFYIYFDINKYFIKAFLGVIKKYKWSFFLIFLFLSYWCLRISQPSTNYDTAAYHLQTIRWINEYQAIFGLGNLWGHLAYNQSYFEFLALLKCFPFFNEGFVLGGLVFFILTGIVIFERNTDRYINFVYLAVLLYLLTHSAGSTLFSPTPDLAVALTEMIIFTIFLNYIKENNSVIKFNEILPLLAVLCCYLFTIKLSSIVFSFTIFISVLIMAIANLSHTKKIIYKIIFVCFAILIVHITNSYIMTGMPLYPSSIGRISNLPWSVSSQQANQEIIDIYNATTGEQAKKFTLVNWVYIFLGLILTLVNFYLLAIKKKLSENYLGLIMLCVALLCSIVFWYLQAPEFRYLCAIFEIYISTSFLLFLSLFHKKPLYSFKFPARNNLRFYIIAIIAISIIPSLNMKLVARSYEGVVLNPELNQFKTRSGIELNIPKGLCWDSPLPCLYTYDSNISLIKPGEMSSGFKINP